MRLKIVHKTDYRFNSEVFLEPHFLRYKPKFTPHHTLEFFDLEVLPNAAGVSEQTDSENNIVHFCWFDGLVRALTIRSESIVFAREFNPFNFLLHPSECFNVPFSYSASLQLSLQLALTATALSKTLIAYREKIKMDSGFNTVQFLTNLTHQIHSDFIVETREEGPPYEADKTFELKRGSCRDLTWMQIQMLRHMGIASRFVSGYYFIPMEKPAYELHAWLEVFLPGAGWIGLDPSNGMFVGNTHIPIATSAQPENTMPVSGTIRGDATSGLSSELMIEALD